MANDLNGNPLVINAAGVVSSTPVRVTAAIYKPAAADDAVVLKDTSGRTLLSLKANHSTAEFQIAVELGDTRFQNIVCESITTNSVLYLYTNATC